MAKRKYAMDISETSGAFRRAIMRKRPKATAVRRTVRGIPRTLGFPNRGATTMPTSYITNHRYCEVFSIDAPVGAAGYYVFAANGMYDPNITGTGHQPMGFDQMSEFYNHYEVIGAKIKFTPHPSQEGAGFNFGVRLDDNGNQSTDITGVLEQPNVNYKSWPGPYLQPNASFDIIQGFSSKKFFGDKSGDRETWGNAAGNPPDIAYFNCFISPLTTLQNPGSVPCTVVIDYIVKWHEPKSFAQS